MRCSADSCFKLKLHSVNLKQSDCRLNICFIGVKYEKQPVQNVKFRAEDWVNRRNIKKSELVTHVWSILFVVIPNKVCIIDYIKSNQGADHQICWTLSWDLHLHFKISFISVSRFFSWVSSSSPVTLTICSYLHTLLLHHIHHFLRGLPLPLWQLHV